MRLQGKVALVAGARKGIGSAVSIALAREGADLILVSRSIKRMDQVVLEVEKRGRSVMVIQVDVGDRTGVFNMVHDAVAYFGRVDVLFNNAGLSNPAMLWKMTDEQWDEIIRVNLTGTFNCLQAAALQMMRQKSGSIINVTSSEALLGTIGQVNYAASKGGVHALTRSAAIELAPYGIRVNSIAPMADTDMTQKIAHDPKYKDKYLQRIPMGRFAQHAEIGPAVVFLAADESKYITGQTLCVDGEWFRFKR
jgi:3-oxoacyl-[acyl-carrier protein] reductase